MYTYYVTNSGLYWPHYYEEWVCGLPLLRVELPKRWSAQRVGRVQRRAGVQGTLNLPGEEKRGMEARLIETRTLWQECGAALAVTALEQREIEPAQAVVGVQANRLSRPVLDALEQLSSQVQALALSLPDREQVALWLQRQNGVPVLEGEGDVTLCFSPAEAGPGRLLLAGVRPEFPALRLFVPGVEIPEGCPAEGLYAALLERGGLPGRPEVVPETRKNDKIHREADRNPLQFQENDGRI